MCWIPIPHGTDSTICPSYTWPFSHSFVSQRALTLFGVCRNHHWWPQPISSFASSSTYVSQWNSLFALQKTIMNLSEYESCSRRQCRGASVTLLLVQNNVYIGKRANFLPTKSHQGAIIAILHAARSKSNTFNDQRCQQLSMVEVFGYDSSRCGVSTQAIVGSSLVHCILSLDEVLTLWVGATLFARL